MDAGYNLAQALTDFADMLDDLEGDARADEVRRLREEARDMLEKVLSGQEEYLQSITEAVDVEAAEESIDEMENEAGMDDVDDPPEEEGDTTTYETHLPTPSALADTTLALVTIHLSLWESTLPSRTPSDIEQSAVRSVLDRAGAFAPPGRQAELDLAEIKVLLTMDGLVWDLFKAEAKVGTGVERSLEGAVAALGALVANLDLHPPDEQTVRADVLTTLAETHTTIAKRMLFLTPQLPPGPSPLAQQAWFHLSQAVKHLTTAVDLPVNRFSPKLFKPSVLLSLSKASFARAKLVDVNETAKRNHSQLMENATTYANRAAEGLEMRSTTVPYPAGWDAESLIRNVLLHQIRISFFTPLQDEVSRCEIRSAEISGNVIQRLKEVGDVERMVTRSDIERWVGEIEEEGWMGEGERTCWKEVTAGLGN